MSNKDKIIENDTWAITVKGDVSYTDVIWIEQRADCGASHRTDKIAVYDEKALRKLIKALKKRLPPKVESTDEAR